MCVQMVQLALELLIDRQGELGPAYINPSLAESQLTSKRNTALPGPTLHCTVTT